MKSQGGLGSRFVARWNEGDLRVRFEYCSPSMATETAMTLRRGNRAALAALALSFLGCEAGLCSEDQLDAFVTLIPDTPPFLVLLEEDLFPRCNDRLLFSASSKAELRNKMDSLTFTDECSPWTLYVTAGVNRGVEGEIKVPPDESRWPPRDEQPREREALFFDVFKLGLDDCQSGVVEPLSPFLGSLGLGQSFFDDVPP